MKKLILSFFILTGILHGRIEAQELNTIEKTLNAVVTIGVSEVNPVKNLYGQRGGEDKIAAYQKALDLTGMKSSGSGFIIEKNGKKYIVTNAHVIENAADSSVFVFSVTREKYSVNVVGGDSFYDLAVLEFIDPPGDEISSIKFAEDEPHIGDAVYAIGNPLGEFPYTVTNGIVSAKNRVRNNITGKYGFLQSTAATIWGNSGGPLINTAGDVLGVVSQTKFAGDTLWQSQINFALEAKLAQRLVDDIVNNKGVIKRAFLGIELSLENHNLFGLQVTVSDNPILSGIMEEAPSYHKLQPYIGWELIEVNGNDIRNLEEALREFEQIKPNEQLKLVLSKQGNKETLMIESSLLETKELEAVAKFTINNVQGLYYDENETIGLRIEKSNFIYMASSTYDNFIKYTPKNKYGDNYSIILAGSNFDNLWSINTLSQLGAVIKLTGLKGTFDFFALPYGGSEDDLEYFRIDLSDNEKTYKKTLYY